MDGTVAGTAPAQGVRHGRRRRPPTLRGETLIRLGTDSFHAHVQERIEQRGFDAARREGRDDVVAVLARYPDEQFDEVRCIFEARGIGILTI